MNSKRNCGLVPPQELIDKIRSGDNFLVATHVNPDGDALGTAIAFGAALEKMGKKVMLLDKHRVPEHYRFLPGHDKFCTYESLADAGHGAGDFQMLVLLDCNEPQRIGLENKLQHPFAEGLKKRLADGMTAIVIDHHETEKGFGEVKWIEPAAAATGLMAFYLIKAMGVEITAEMAINLYAAIVIDTGNFRYENATAEVFRVAAELIDCGARPNRIYQELYESWSDNRFRLYLRMIESLDMRDDVVFGVITGKMFEETGATAEDTENFVSFPRVVKSVAVSVMLREIGKDEYKVSLRSKGDVNVAKIAEMFDGGGHKNAAGCRIRADIAAAKDLLFGKIKALQKR
ncbi:MAG TPA: bifunctional oligoribonuclease/PAP phosphatase NrnA [Dissulfurispiraceae bacterium]|nr:bifunctional oligoribonuclease/PAP phosphatase NrnA [Dissulfurispiraceae bacterium]